MRGAPVFLPILLSLAAAANAVEFETPDRMHLSEILFPETRDWLVVDSLPSPGMEALRSERWRLRYVFLTTEQHALIEAPECSFITRALYEFLDVEQFKVADFDGDGSTDIMYSGPAQCDEGSAAVIWFGGDNGPATRPVAIIPFGLLKVELEGRRRMIGVKAACCAGEEDDYFVGDLANPGSFGRARVHRALYVPDEMELVGEEYAARGRLVLRQAPIENDEYDKYKSVVSGRAVYGAIVAEYLPGATGRIVATFKNDRGKRWGLVIVDEASQALRTGGPESINVGWALVK
jgi:hypothetical protein